ncbi:MAG: multicopper oxidase domain-containing protein [Gemmatimonadales bacterium]|nr:multicopper oxidase domain-containing protein [Gemmatimonadales bacterium]
MVRFVESACLVALVFALPHGSAGQEVDGPHEPPLSTIQANDNRTPAGILKNGVVRVELDAAMGMWHPEADDGIGLQVMAFRERGKPLHIPGPLIRVPVGTDVEISIRNLLKEPLVLHGFPTSGGADTVQVAAGETRRLNSRLDHEGTFYYWASSTNATLKRRSGAETQLAGAIVVDPAGRAVDDRVFVMTRWDQPPDTTVSPPTEERVALAINGKSWPHTERLTYAIGDSVHWRWINATDRAHPMHLHGYFFRVDSKGDGRVDTLYAPPARRLAVTEDIRRGQTATLSWQPPFHAGNWLFHCHLSFHVSGDLRLTPPVPDSDGSHGDAQHMAGLVLGVHVVPREGQATALPARGTPRLLRLVAAPIPGRFGTVDGMGFALEDDARGNEPLQHSVPGPMLLLTRDEPVDVRVVNQLSEPTSVHWHGLELDSYSDGVPDWSGSGAKIARAIAPGDSFTAELTLKRAGTYIYHSHLQDIRQLSRGLYGAIVILEPGQRFDPATDHVFALGWGGGDEEPHIAVNGDSTPPPLDLAGGTTHRLRFLNIAPAGGLPVSLSKDSLPVTWRPLAKDGADLPPSQSTSRPARLFIQVGETADFEFTPPSRGDYHLRIAKRSMLLRVR